MDFEFSDDDLRRLFTEPGFDGGWGAAIVKGYRRRINFLVQALDLRDLYASNGLGFEQLKGKRQHQHAIRINNQWRIILEFRKIAGGKSLFVVGIEDYH